MCTVNPNIQMSRNIQLLSASCLFFYLFSILSFSAGILFKNTVLTINSNTIMQNICKKRRKGKHHFCFYFKTWHSFCVKAKRSGTFTPNKKKYCVKNGKCSFYYIMFIIFSMGQNCQSQNLQSTVEVDNHCAVFERFRLSERKFTF